MTGSFFFGRQQLFTVAASGAQISGGRPPQQSLVRENQQRAHAVEIHGNR